MTKLVYPDGRAGEFLVVVDLLKSNGVVEHYDLMRRYARRGEINGRRVFWLQVIISSTSQRVIE